MNPSVSMQIASTTALTRPFGQQPYFGNQQNALKPVTLQDTAALAKGPAQPNWFERLFGPLLNIFSPQPMEGYRDGSRLSDMRAILADFQAIVASGVTQVSTITEHDKHTKSIIVAMGNGQHYKFIGTMPGSYNNLTEGHNTTGCFQFNQYDPQAPWRRHHEKQNFNLTYHWGDPGSISISANSSRAKRPCSLMSAIGTPPTPEMLDDLNQTLHQLAQAIKANASPEIQKMLSSGE